MRAILPVLCAVLGCLCEAAAEDSPLALPATKDVRVTFYPAEAEFNGGRSPRLRTSNIKLNAGEAILMDFDRAAVAAFLEKNKARQVSAKLVLVSRGLRHGSSAKVEVAALDTASDWVEGEQAQAAAAKGEPTFKAAQHETKAWTTPDGKEVANLRDLFYDSAMDTLKTLLNENSVTVRTADSEKPVEVELDAKFLEHLAKAPACKGLIVFNRDRSMLSDFYSREHDTHGPKLVLTARDAAAEQAEAKK
ncbi:MAG: hypothetical protein KIS92_09155 [Planctomycetota bacterium]|nr:hypothetical protein [Planctomycetota bacterium]